ncbi:MAG TPA: helix-turn-helix domain-containing protein [Longimicrobium sp.]|jgi:AraC-like DNA-binding protein
MQAVIRPVFLLHDDPDLRSRLAGVLTAADSLVRVADWDALRAALRRAPATAISVVDGMTGLGELRVLLEELPSATVLAAVSPGPSHGDLLRKLFALGVADVIVLGREDTPPALSRRVDGVRARTVHRLLERALPRNIPSRSRALLAVAAETVAAGGLAPEMAAALGVKERTVLRWCERAELPPPRRLLAWLRLLMSAELLDDPGRSVSAIAEASGYASGVSLKAAFRQFVGATPREARERGAFETVSGAFARELFELREAARDQGRPEKTWLN